MRDYFFDPNTLAVLQAYASKPQGSLLIVGSSDSSPAAAVEYVVGRIYPDAATRDVHYLSPESKNPADATGYSHEVVRIDTIRETLNHLSLTRFNPRQPRLLIINDYDKVTLPAQNAMLKDLEEPVAGNHFLLTSTNPATILATIKSRCQLVQLRRPDKQTLRQAFSEVSDSDFETAYLIADGWPFLLEAYLNQSEHVIHDEIKVAKEFLNYSTTEKVAYLLNAQQARLNPQQLRDFLALLLNGLNRVARAALLSSADKAAIDKIRSWRQLFVQVNNLRNDLDSYVNPKLIALKLSLL